MSKQILSGMSLDELTAFTDSIDESKYRAKTVCITGFI